MGGLAAAAAIMTPLAYVATRPGGNWIELHLDHLRLKRWWIGRLDVPYSAVEDVRESSRHNPFASFAFLNRAPFEEHVDIKVEVEGFRRMWALTSWVAVDGYIHISPTDRHAFVESLASRIAAI
jgi:hypothetical protein